MIPHSLLWDSSSLVPSGTWLTRGTRRSEKGRTVPGKSIITFVFPVKYRKALLDEEVAGIIQETAAEISDRVPIEMEAIGTDKNHIHVLCSAHPKMAPGRIVQIFKSITAREIFR